jgi:hypothetical protein
MRGRSTREYRDLVERSREAYCQSLRACFEAGGERLLGPVPGPGTLERKRHGEER